MAERSAVNRKVTGSSPVLGVISFYIFFAADTFQAVTCDDEKLTDQLTQILRYANNSVLPIRMISAENAIESEEEDPELV